MRPVVKPPRLRPGDLVGVVAPSAPVDTRRAEVEAGMRQLEAYGFRVREGASLWVRQGVRAGTREAQLADLYAMWADPEVKAIFCATGGITAITLVDGLEYDLVARRLKALIGMSDITVLQAALLSRTGLVSFHASGLAEGLGSPDADREGPHLLRLLTSAVLRGLTQLRLAGALDGVAALLFGHMEGCFRDRPSPAEGLALAVEEALGDLDLPVYQTEAFGHCVPNVTLPIGAMAAIQGGRLVLEEGAVL
ncbi:MAG: LD-carboxypeptidase [Symbiobacterium sp.]|uniref:LD-carboxypeptidase n=1 Tax=Symbiobacterium sp. TaxID=1971213 RepID=UPI0034648E83